MINRMPPIIEIDSCRELVCLLAWRSPIQIIFQQEIVLTIKPVFEAPWYKDMRLLPWPIANVEAFSFVPITCDIEDAAIGSFFAGFVPESDPPDVRSAVFQLEDILEDGVLVRDGGLAFEFDGIAIYPGCCGDLGAMSEWLRFLSTGEQPWAGHDPAPWATLDGDDIAIWSDGGLDDRRIDPCIHTTRQEFEDQLTSACMILSKFGARCGKWLHIHQIPRADELHERIIADFDIPIQQ